MRSLYFIAELNPSIVGTRSSQKLLYMNLFGLFDLFVGPQGVRDKLLQRDIDVIHIVPAFRIGADELDLKGGQVIRSNLAQHLLTEGLAASSQYLSSYLEPLIVNLGLLVNVAANERRIGPE